ncbi:2-oxo acid dehydrogenase subunit E2 [Eubacteriales bacterium OttesenSCG-928-K08]|nr:2-oxo acid dehydrogenase subunit E2 [Eubacteriales bacterium OttesenSCG-928-K08]
MAVEIIMPKLGLTMTEGLVAKWHKKEGDPVSRGDMLFEVETDKLTNEVEADCDGILLKIIAEEGASVPCTQVVAYVGAAGEALPEQTAKQAQAADQPEEQAVQHKKQAEEAVKANTDGYVLATPAAKALAKQRGLDISTIPSSGPQGSVIMKDVEAFEPIPQKKASGLAAKIAQELGMDVSALASEGRVMSEDVLRAALTAEQADTEEPLSGMRRTIARRMSESWAVSPRVCYEMAVDCSNMIELRSQLKNQFADNGLKLTYNHIITRAAAQALREYPQINASLEGDILKKHAQVNIGLAVGVKNGLLVPNLKNCGRMGLLEIAQGMEEMIRQAREGSLAMDALVGGTFTITNLGMYGIRSFSPIINQPELAILGVSAMVDTPVVRGQEVVIRPMMTLNLVADHRVADGVLAASFFSRIVALLENPALMLA